jgi:hypothetical protein
MELIKMEKNQEVSEFSINDILPIILILAITVLAGAYILKLVGDQKENFTGNSTAYNATVKGEEAIASFFDNLPTIAGIVALVIIITVLLVLTATGRTGRR